MGQIDRIIFFQNAVETLGYFSEQIVSEVERLGFAVYFIDYDNLYESLEGLSHFAVPGKTALLTFNFIGLAGEEIFRREDGGYLWEDYQMQYLNILVDHPFYYHEKLLQNLPGMAVFCIDRVHVGYIERFYPGTRVRFLPLAGNVMLEKDARGAYSEIWNYERALVPYNERKYDLVFTANYVPFGSLYQRILDLEAEYAVFYREILDDLLGDPAQCADAVMERHIRERLGEVSSQEMRAAMSGMALIDLCVRAYFRDAILGELANAGVRVHVFGADWEFLPCKRPENIIKNGGQVDSAVCVRAVRDARISLNIMPWFKDGVHDRIFTAMLQKTIALTDGSKYLRENFEDGQGLVYFSLEKRGRLPEIIGGLLGDPARAVNTAESGYPRVYAAHTWRERARFLAEEIRETYR